MTAAFTPTASEREKYADYDVEIRPARNNRVRCTVIDGEVVRLNTRAHRVPALKKFIVYTYIGCDQDDLDFIERWARNLPVAGGHSSPTSGSAASRTRAAGTGRRKSAASRRIPSLSSNSS